MQLAEEAVRSVVDGALPQGGMQLPSIGREKRDQQASQSYPTRRFRVYRFSADKSELADEADRAEQNQQDQSVDKPSVEVNPQQERHWQPVENLAVACTATFQQERKLNRKKENRA